MPDVESLVAADLAVPCEAIAQALVSARTSYRKIRIKKKSGGTRVVLQPAIETKMLQGWVVLRLISKLPVSSIATAFEPRTSILLNAEEHRDFAYSVRVDLSDFFPSISFTDLRTVLAANASKLPIWACQEDVLKLVNTACFDFGERLPVGYPSSPRIANAVMRRFDEELQRTLHARKDVYGSFALTRYADDFTFSTDKRGGCAAFVDTIRDLLSRTSSPRLQLNERKTRFMSKAGGSTLVTGLRVKQNGDIGVHAHYRDHIRLQLKHYANGTLRMEELKSLQGHMAFIAHTDPALLTKLSYKYLNEIAKLRSGDAAAQLVSSPTLAIPKAA